MNLQYYEFWKSQIHFLSLLKKNLPMAGLRAPKTPFQISVTTVVVEWLKLVVLKRFGLRIIYTPLKILEDTKELSFVWVISVVSYHIRN